MEKVLYSSVLVTRDILRNAHRIGCVYIGESMWLSNYYLRKKFISYFRAIVAAPNILTGDVLVLEAGIFTEFSCLKTGICRKSCTSPSSFPTFSPGKFQGMKSGRYLRTSVKKG
jgi:hypothetical protein